MILLRKAKTSGKEIFLPLKRQWKYLGLMYCLMSLLLTSCLQDEAPIATVPLVTASQISASPTFIFPTMPPTKTIIPEPSLTPTSSSLDLIGNVIFEDDFGQNRGWELNEMEFGAVSLQSEHLVIAIRQANSFLYSLVSPLTLDDFFLEIEVRADLCQSGDEFGILFRVNQDLEHYRYALNCDGSARAVRILSNESRSLVPITEPPSVLPGPRSTNRLSLLASGDQFWFWINGFEVFNARDINLTQGGLGLFARSGRGNQLTVSFDNLRIQELTPTTNLTPTPTP
jgi:hypothetical protein